MGQESKDELQKILQLLEDVVRDAEAEIQRLQSLTEQEELYLDPEGTLSQALKRRIGAQHTIAEPACLRTFQINFYILNVNRIDLIS